MKLAGVLSQLVYVSKATSLMSEDDLRRLSRVAAQKNATRNITGLLLYRAGWFLQALEGDPIVLSELYHDTIAHDPRHVDIERLSFAYADTRAFPNWSMRHVDLDAHAPLSNEDFSALRAFAATVNAIPASKSVGLVIRTFESAIDARLNAAA